MSWNPDPRVADCRDIARKWGGKDIVIIIAFDSEGRMDWASFGKTKPLCNAAFRLAQAATDGEGLQNYINRIEKEMRP